MGGCMGDSDNQLARGVGIADNSGTGAMVPRVGRFAMDVKQVKQRIAAERAEALGNVRLHIEGLTQVGETTFELAGVSLMRLDLPTAAMGNALTDAGFTPAEAEMEIEDWAASLQRKRLARVLAERITLV